jgi:nitroimidazol reductase NimA-like FMN-containing flavoprotein (pyridoxamine 5'-phosphate oxidase superfamily)
VTRPVRELAVLSTEECVYLLGTAEIGRVVVSMDALPAALPVNYRVVGEEIVFQTAPGTKLAAAVSRTVLGFQVDRIDTRARRGWSVLVVGLSRVVEDPAEARELERAGVQTWWSTAPEMRFVAIAMARVSGRRLGEPSPSGT